LASIPTYRTCAPPKLRQRPWPPRLRRGIPARSRNQPGIVSHDIANDDQNEAIIIISNSAGRGDERRGRCPRRFADARYVARFLLQHRTGHVLWVCVDVCLLGTCARSVHDGRDDHAQLEKCNRERADVVAPRNRTWRHASPVGERTCCKQIRSRTVSTPFLNGLAAAHSDSRLLIGIRMRALTARQRRLAGLAQSVRAAFVIPSLFALALLGLKQPQLAGFAVFGTFAHLVMVDYDTAGKAPPVPFGLLTLFGVVMVAIGGFSFPSVWVSVGWAVGVGLLTQIGPPGRRPLGGHSDSIATVVHVGSSCTCSRPLRLPISGGMATGGYCRATGIAVDLDTISSRRCRSTRPNSSREHGQPQRTRRPRYLDRKCH